LERSNAAGARVPLLPIAATADDSLKWSCNIVLEQTLTALLQAIKGVAEVQRGHDDL
jgi:hypothetical protein